MDGRIKAKKIGALIMDRETLKKLNQKYGENLFFQYLLRDYLKTGNAEEIKSFLKLVNEI